MRRMQAHATNVPYDEPSEADLKAVELELALGATDIAADGFEASVDKACDACGLAFVFNLPVFDHPEVQRVAAVAWRDDENRIVMVFVTLAHNGRMVQVDPTCDCLPHAEAVASAWFDLTTI